MPTNSTRLFAPMDQFQAHIRQSQRIALQNHWVTPLPVIITHRDAVSLVAEQTPLTGRVQGDRGTCWAFAGIAALEAAYRRKHGLTLDLSEHYLFHAIKAHESDAGLSSFDGFGGASDIITHMKKLAVPTQADAPYLTQAQMRTLRNQIPAAGQIDSGAGGTQAQRDAFEFDLRHIPLEARWNARYRVADFGSIVNYTNADIEALITDRKEVVVDVATPGGGHVVLIVGFDRRARTFTAKNWWGQGQYETIAYDGNAAFMLQRSQAYYVKEVVPPNQPPQIAAAWIGRWQMSHDGWRGTLIIRRFARLSGADPVSPQTATKLGTYERDNQRFDVNGYFQDGGQRLVFHIAPSPAPVAPGTLTGEPYEVVLFGRDLTKAAGRTRWAGRPFGVVLSRELIPGIPSPSFDRSESIGVWSFSHDGWPGTLRLGAPAWYRGADNRKLPVSAQIAPTGNHVQAGIPFSANAPQPFDLLVHTREDGLLAGTTSFGGRTFGVFARLQAPLYGVKADGDLIWYSHEGRGNGSFEWGTERKVGNGWGHFAALIPGGDGVLYAMHADGKLLWYRHLGRAQGQPRWEGPREVGTGWNGFRQIVPAGCGVLYGIKPDGQLLWYRHTGRDVGSWGWEGPRVVGNGWHGFHHVFAGNHGSLYAIEPGGDLLWYRHDGQPDGSTIWKGPLRIGNGWQNFRTVFACEAGSIYAIAQNGDLLLYRHLDQRGGRPDWAPHARVGTGWGGFRWVVAS